MTTTTTGARARLPRTLAGLASHPWVDSIDDGRATGDNLCVYLRPGYVWAGTTSAVIEPTVRDVCRAFKEVAWDPAAWGQACGASAAEVAELTGEATPAPAEAAPAALTAGQTEASWHLMLTRAVGRQIAARPVLPGEATPPPAPSHGEAAPQLPRLRADAAAGRPVSLAALARAMAEDLLTPSPSPVSLAALRPEA